jgi:hypothetical protein
MNGRLANAVAATFKDLRQETVRLAEGLESPEAWAVFCAAKIEALHGGAMLDRFNESGTDEANVVFSAHGMRFVNEASKRAKAALKSLAARYEAGELSVPDLLWEAGRLLDRAETTYQLARKGD